MVLAHVMKRITMVTSKSVRMADSVANSFHFHANPTPAEPKNKKFKIHFSNLPIIIYDFFFGRREPPLLYYHVVYPYINPPPSYHLSLYLPSVCPIPAVSMAGIALPATALDVVALCAKVIVDGSIGFSTTTGVGVTKSKTPSLPGDV